CYKYRQYPLPTLGKLRRKLKIEETVHPPFDDVNIVFLAGGTCRIPFVQIWIKEIFPNAEVKIDEQLETITATGAAIHALQVCSGEIEPYIKIQNPDNYLIDARKQWCEIL